MKKLLLILVALVTMGCVQSPRAPEQVYAEQYFCVPQPKKERTECYPMHGALAGMQDYKGGIVIGAVVPRAQAMMLSGQFKKLDINIGSTFGWRIIDAPRQGEKP